MSKRAELFYVNYEFSDQKINDNGEFTEERICELLEAFLKSEVDAITNEEINNWADELFPYIKGIGELSQSIERQKFISYIGFFKRKLSRRKMLEFTYTNFGMYYRCEIDGVRVSREDFEKLTGIDTRSKGGRTLEYMLDQWDKTQDEYEVKYWEKDVS